MSRDQSKANTVDQVHKSAPQPISNDDIQAENNNRNGSETAGTTKHVSQDSEDLELPSPAWKSLAEETNWMPQLSRHHSWTKEESKHGMLMRPSNHLGPCAGFIKCGGEACCTSNCPKVDGDTVTPPRVGRRRGARRPSMLSPHSQQAQKGDDRWADF
jgi:hypothetical protein